MNDTNNNNSPSQIQTVFDTIVNHLRAQNCKSWNEYKQCLYRGQNGTKCAAGCLIPDEYYNAGMEGITFCGILQASDKLREFLNYDKYTLNLVGDMQYIHDHYDVQIWERDFEIMAKKYSLIYSKV